MAELFSVSEAAAIAEVSPETIRTALEKKSVAPSSKRKTGKTVRYQFSVGDVLFVKVLVESRSLSARKTSGPWRGFFQVETGRRPAGQERVRTSSTGRGTCRFRLSARHSDR